MARQHLILDCDPGVDDALAILLALASPELALEAVTCVAGNVDLDRTAANALRVLDLAGRGDVPVHAGCARPLMRRVGVDAAWVHGDDGLGGIELPPPAGPLADGHAVDIIIETARRLPTGTLTLCPIGPLTNIALAIVKAPDIVERLAGIVLMGGAAFNPGNVTPAAEFNIYVDPHAAHIVFEAGAPLVMHGLDVTHKAPATAARRQALGALPAPIGPRLIRMLGGYGSGDPFVHDACAVAWLLAPELFETVEARVEVECASPLNLGQTVARVKPRHLDGAPVNARIATGIDDDGFFALLTERLARLAAEVAS